jgi:hypothetical protein
LLQFCTYNFVTIFPLLIIRVDKNADGRIGEAEVKEVSNTPFP